MDVLDELRRAQASAATFGTVALTAERLKLYADEVERLRAELLDAASKSLAVPARLLGNDRYGDVILGPHGPVPPTRHCVGPGRTEYRVVAPGAAPIPFTTYKLPPGEGSLADLLRLPVETDAPGLVSPSVTTAEVVGQSDTLYQCPRCDCIWRGDELATSFRGARSYPCCDRPVAAGDRVHDRPPSNPEE